MVAFDHPGQGAALEGLADGDLDIEKVMDHAAFHARYFILSRR